MPCLNQSYNSLLKNGAIPLALLLFQYTVTSSINFYFIDSGNYITQIYIYICCCWGSLAVLLSKRLNFFISKIDILVFFLFLIIIFKNILCNTDLKSIFLIIITNFFAYFIARSLTICCIDYFLKVILILGFACLLLYSFYIPVLLESWINSYNRYEFLGSRSNTVIYSYFIGIFYIVLMSTFINKKSCRKSIFISLMFLVYILLILSGSKTALLLTIIISLLSVRGFLIRIGIIMFLIILSIIVASYFIPDNLLRFFSRVDFSGIQYAIFSPLDDKDNFLISGNTSFDDEENSLAVRIFLIRNALVQFLENPLFGYELRKYIIPHSTVIQIFCEYGAVAGILFLTIIISTFRKLIHSYYSQQSTLNKSALFFLFLYAFIYNQFLSYAENQTLLFITIGCSVTLFSRPLGPGR